MTLFKTLLNQSLENNVLPCFWDPPSILCILLVFDHNYLIIVFHLVGCWIIYKSLENKMHELVAYEFMSANDAPERDPMDWYVF